MMIRPAESTTQANTDANASKSAPDELDSLGVDADKTEVIAIDRAGANAAKRIGQFRSIRCRPRALPKRPKWRGLAVQLDRSHGGGLCLAQSLSKEGDCDGIRNAIHHAKPALVQHTT